MQRGFSLDLTRCSGCMACVVACMDQNDLAEDGPSFRQVVRFENGKYPRMQLSFVSISCFHCSESPCMRACPRSAIFRDVENDVVAVHEDLCIGCGVCSMVCPFGAPQFFHEGTMHKCNLCIERVNLGLEPACVRTCPTKALQFGPLAELSKSKAKGAAKKIWGAAI